MKEFNNADYLFAKNECGFDLNPESRIPNFKKNKNSLSFCFSVDFLS
jgi:hypothetical protein